MQRTASASEPPAASHTAVRFSRQRRVCPSTSSFTISPVDGSSGIWPEQNSRLPLRMPWL